MTVLKTHSHYTVMSTPYGFSVLRNAAVLKTPAGQDLLLRKQALAEAIAGEWQRQTDKIIPATMPMMQFAATTLDITSRSRDQVTNRILAYIGSELLCHRADFPQDLVNLQKKIWQPYLDWCEELWGVSLTTGSGIMPIAQKPEAVETMRRHIENFDNWFLTGLCYAVESSGSFVLGLALAKKFRTAEDISQAAELDATFQMQKWGEAEAIQQRQLRLRQDLDEVSRWFDLI